MRILLWQIPWYGENCFSNHVRDGLAELGQEVETGTLGVEAVGTLLERARRFRPQAMVIFMGYYLRPEIVLALRAELDPIMVLWENDDPWRLQELSLRWAPHFDLCVTNDPYSLTAYVARGHQRALHLPFGCNPNLHFPEPGRSATWDLSFVGSCYPERVELLKLLAGYDLKIWGDEQWARSPLSHCYVGTSIRSGAKLREIYQGSKINLNIHFGAFRPPRESGTFTNQRPYEILGCGGFCLTDWRLHTTSEFVDGRHLAFFRNATEMVGAVEHYLRHEEERQRIVAEGCRLVGTQYTYRQRLETFVATLEEPRRARAWQPPAAALSSPLTRHSRQTRSS